MADKKEAGRLRDFLGRIFYWCVAAIRHVTYIRATGIFLRRHAYVATWIQGIVVVPVAIFAASQYYWEIQRTKSSNTLQYIEMSFTSSELLETQVSLESRLRDIYRKSMDAMETSNPDPKNSFWAELQSRLKTSYENDRKFSAHVNSIFSYVNAVHHCIESGLCRTEPLKTIRLFKTYYPYLHSIAVCQDMPEQEQILKSYYLWLGYDVSRKMPSDCLA